MGTVSSSAHHQFAALRLPVEQLARGRLWHVDLPPDCDQVVQVAEGDSRVPRGRGCAWEGKWQRALPAEADQGWHLESSVCGSELPAR